MKLYMLFILVVKFVVMKKYIRTYHSSTYPINSTHPFLNISHIVFGTEMKEHILRENYTSFGQDYH
jgi:hypothetical protein